MKELTKKQSLALYKDWKREIEAYEQDSEVWESRSKKIIERYRDARKLRAETKAIRYNILWSNVQVLKPALYARDPIPRVERRFKQKDSPSRVGAQIVQNCLSYLIECGNFGDAMRSAVVDRLLPGRGIVWIRYEPTFKEVTVQTTDDVTGETTESTEEKLDYEKAIPDYVHWQDFGHTWARTFEELRAGWRISYLTREQLVERFGDIAKDIPLTHSPYKDDDDTRKKGGDGELKAPVYEIWDKETEKVIWLCKEYKEGVLDAKDDPLELEGFFPFPKPLFATLANDDLIPTPDYVQYQDQAAELDELTARISLIVSAVRVAGVYDASAPGIGRLLSEGLVENKMIAVSKWAMFAERGGLKSAMELLPVLQIAQTLQQLYISRDHLKNDIYEITGMSDIIRGATDANETAKAQEIKSQYVNLRLGETQKDVERFARDLLRIMADLVSSRFSQETLAAMSGIQLMTQEQKAQIQQVAQSGQPLPPEIQEGMNKPTWEEVLGVLRNDKVRNFRIEVETDSTIAINDKDEKEGVNEFMMAAGQYMQGMVMAIKEGAIPQDVGKQILLQAFRKYRFGSEIEEALDQIVEKPQSPEAQKQIQEAKQVGEQAQQKVQEAQKAGQDLQLQQAQFKTEVDGANKSLDMAKQGFAADQKIAQTELQSMFKSLNVEFQSTQKIAQAEAVSAMSKIQTSVDTFLKKLEIPAEKAKEAKDAQQLQGMAQANNEVKNLANAAVDALAQSVAPRDVDIIRDPATGRPTQLRVVPQKQANANQ